MDRKLSARTRQVLDVFYRLGEVSAADLLRELPELPSYSAARSILRSLEQRGLVRHREKGLRYVYVPTVPKVKASRSALAQMIGTFFDGSPERVLKSLLDLSRDRRFKIDYDEFARMIDDARRDGR